MKTKTILIILVVLMAIVAFSSIKSCISTKKEKEAQNEALNRQIELAIDSVNIKVLKEKEIALDSQAKSYKAIIAELKKKGVKYKTAYTYSVEQIDTTKYSATCIQALDDCANYVVNLEQTVDTMGQTIAIQEEQIFVMDNITTLKDKQISNYKNNITLLEMELKSKKNWFNRNKFKLGFGTGVVVSVAGIAGLIYLAR